MYKNESVEIIEEPIFKASNHNFTKVLSSILDQDQIFSPLSILYVLSLLHHGASENTEKQLDKIFGKKYSWEQLEKLNQVFNVETNKSLVSQTVKLANAVIINKNCQINDSYLDAIGKLARIVHEDFRNVAHIVKITNEFIENGTNHLIKNIIKNGDITPDILMILINTIYFKASWSEQFKKNLTKKEYFNKDKIVDMMMITNTFNYYEDSKKQILELLYQSQDYSMGFILPAPGVTLDVNELDFDPAKFKYQNVEVHIPKFTHRVNIDLIPVLQKMGLTDLFNDNCNLNKICSNIHVSKVIHEAVVIVDENGTEAAAVTVVMMKESYRRKSKEPVIFYANRSFIYYIRHVSGLVLFFGHYHG